MMLVSGIVLRATNFEHLRGQDALAAMTPANFDGLLRLSTYRENRSIF